MKKSLFTVILLVTLATVSFGSNKAEAYDNTDNDKGSGLVIRGDKSAKVTNCYWGNNMKWIGIREEPYQTVYADFNFAAEVTSGTYTFTTFANEHILDGGYTWGGVFILNEGGESTIVSGTLEITVKEDYCKLKATGKDDEGQDVTVTWEGPMKKDPTDY